MNLEGLLFIGIVWVIISSWRKNAREEQARKIGEEVAKAIKEEKN